MKKALVTGAHGFIGQSLCRELMKNGVEVIAVIRNRDYDAEDLAELNGAMIVKCEMSNFCHLAEMLDDQCVDVFYQLAWTGSAGPLRGDSEAQLKNVQYTCDAVKSCQKLGCKRFVFAASIMEYEILSLVENESAPSINGLYSAAKLSADYMANIIANNLNIDYIRAIIGNVYGPGEKSSRLINTSLRKLLQNEHCSFSAGTQLYDFIYIDDAVRMFYAIGEKGKKNRKYYIGNQRPRPLKEFLLEMKNQVDKNINLGLGEISFSGISLTYDEFDMGAVSRDTGYYPQISFTDGIKHTITWIKEKMI